jgi:hypothetical protein
MMALRRVLGPVAVVFLAAALPVNAAEADKFLPEDTVLVGSINVKQIVESPLFKQYGEGKLRELLKTQDEATQILGDLGFDPFKDLTSVTTAFTSVGPGAKPYMIAHGKFDVAKFAAKADEAAKNHGEILKIHKEGGHAVYEVTPPSEQEALFVAVVDNSTMVAAHDKDFVAQSFSRAADSQSKAKKEIQDLIARVDPKFSAWFVVPGTALSQGELGKQEEAKKIVDKIDSVIGGIAINKDVKLSATLGAGSADNAKQLAEAVTKQLDDLKKAIQMFPAPPEFAPLVNLANDIKTATEGSAVTIKAEVSEATIKEAVKKAEK